MSKSPSLRRIQADIRELSLDPSDQYYAAPLENDMFEWHFTIRGAPDTDFAGGIYHGRILLPPEYPFKPPHILFLTPSGRFETNTKICLSFSAFHPELWQPAWGIRLILEALIAFLPSPADGAIGALDWSSTERKRLASKSKDYCCALCGKVADLLPPLKEGATVAKTSRFQKEIEKLQRLQSIEHQKEDEEKGSETTSETKTVTISENKPEIAAENAAATTTAPSPAPAAVTVKETNHTEPSVSSTPDSSPLRQTPALTVEVSTEEAKAAIPAPVVSTTPNLEQEASENSISEHQVAVEPSAPAMDAPASTTTAVVNNNEDVANVAQPVNEGVAVNEANEQNAAKPSWIVEPAIQLAILVLSAICFLLLRKIQELCAELQALEE